MNAKQMKEFMKALDHIVEEKGIDKQIVIDAMEQAMAAAYKKNEGVSNVEAKVDPETGEIKREYEEQIVGITSATEEPYIEYDSDKTQNCILMESTCIDL